MTRKLSLPEGNIALAALKTHKAARETRRRTPATLTAPTVTPNPTTQPLPPSRQVHLCVVCHTNNPNTTTPATWITNIGHTLCDTHKLEHDQNGHLPILKKLHP